MCSQEGRDGRGLNSSHTVLVRTVKIRPHLGDLRSDGKNFEKQGVNREGHSNVSKLEPVEGHL